MALLRKPTGQVGQAAKGVKNDLKKKRRFLGYHSARGTTPAPLPLRNVFLRQGYFGVALQGSSSASMISITAMLYAVVLQWYVLQSCTTTRSFGREGV